MSIEHIASYESHDAPIGALLDDIESSGSTTQYLRDVEDLYMHKDAAAIHQLRRAARAFEPAGLSVPVDTTYPLGTRIYQGALLGMALSEKIIGSHAWLDIMYTRVKADQGIVLEKSLTAGDDNERRDLRSAMLIRRAEVSFNNLIPEHQGLISDIANSFVPTESIYKHVCLGFGYIMGHTYNYFHDAELIGKSIALEAQVYDMFDQKFLRSFAKQLRHLDAS